MIPGNIKPQTTTLPSIDENHVLPESKPTLETLLIDFSQHITKLAYTQNITAKLTADNTTPVIDEKQQKRIVIDSNLIDWVLTDEI